jgi:3-methylcrotonyl-CoA carboxylase alpha subunit
MRACVQVSPFYDPMISKLIVRGPDRAAALRKLDLALSQYEARPRPVPLPFAMAPGHRRISRAHRMLRARAARSDAACIA